MSDKVPKVERLTASSRFRFQCTRCTQCCRHVMQIVPLDSQDIFRICKYLQDHGMDIFCTDDFLSQFGEPAMLDLCGYFVYFLKSTGEDDACIFLKGNKCAIQACKPKACRMYPFVIEPNPGGKVPYLLSHEREYHFKGPLISAKAWLKDNLPKEDQEFLQIDYGEAPALVTSLKRIPENRRTEALLHFHRLKYSEYDLAQPFLPQYKRNITKLKTILHTMEDTSIGDHETMLAD